MNILPVATKAKFFLLRFIQLQLFITLFSLPILIAWGLPFSLLSPLGNLIFSPVLTLFLFLCSLIFFTELLTIPNQWFIYCLEQLTKWWLWCMHADAHRWLIGFKKPSVVFLVSITTLSIIIMLWKKTNSLYRSIGCLSVLFISVAFYAHYASRPTSLSTTLACNKGEVTILLANKQLIVIDPGYIGQRISAPSWVQYTLIPHIIKLTGKTTIDYLILMQPGSMAFEAAATLCTKMDVKNICMPYWDGSMAHSGLWRYGALKRTMAAHNTQFVRIAQPSTCIKLGKNARITLEQLDTTITHQEFYYPALMCQAYIDNQTVTLYSAKYTKKNHIQSHQNNTKLE